MVFLLCASATEAFDGNRAGFVLGGGAGIAPLVYWSEDPGGDSYQGVGAGFGFMIGYGWNRNNLLVWEMDLAALNHEFERSYETCMQGYAGPSWYRYFGRPGRAAFLAVGLGLQQFLYRADYFEDDCSSTEAGGCVRLGAGYEFARHFQVTLSWSNGLTYGGPPYRNDYAHSTLNVLVSVVGY